MRKTDNIPKLKSIDDFAAFRDLLFNEGVLAPGRKRIRVCCGTGCRANQSLALVEQMVKEAGKNEIDL
jgi:hypothetical protein